jgi:hypothetical protein
VAVALVTACGRTSPPPGLDGSAGGDVTSLRGEWVLQRLETDERTVPLDSGDAIDLTIGATSLRGSLPCGSYATVFAADAAGNFRAEPMAFAPGTCGSGLSAAEATFIDGLEDATAWGIDGDGGLRLAGSGAVLTFRRLPQATESPVDPDYTPPYEGTWLLVHLVTPEGDRRLVGLPEVRLTIGGGRFTATGACWSLGGQAVAVGARGLGFEALTHTPIACRTGDAPETLEPETLAALDADVERALATVGRWQEDPDEDSIRLTGGDFTLQLERLSDATGSATASAAGDEA